MSGWAGFWIACGMVALGSFIESGLGQIAKAWTHQSNRRSER